MDYSYRTTHTRLGVVRRWQPRYVAWPFPLGADLPHPQQPLPVADSLNPRGNPPGGGLFFPDSTHTLHSQVRLLLPSPHPTVCA